MADKQLSVRIVSLQKTLFDGPAQSVSLPGTVGAFEVLPGHAPIISSLEPGTIEVRDGHVGDSYEWHITKVGDTDITIPLPCIVIDDGLHVFSSKHMAEHGYTLNADGKLVNAATMERPLDISITKNVLALMINAALLLGIILGCARWYRKHDVLKEKPRGLVALMEPVIMFVESDLIRDVIGPGYKKYAPYLMTAFFFILVNNLMGIFPFFPGGANTTGNIAVTLVLAVFTFIMVNVFGTRNYFKEIFWPDVPVFLKAIPLMPIIEIIGVFTKPFSLMIRLFANTLGGHIMILSMVGLIFISASMGAVVNGSFTYSWPSSRPTCSPCSRRCSSPWPIRPTNMPPKR